MKVQKIINAGHKSQSGGLLVEVRSALMNTTRTCFVTQSAIQSNLDKFTTELSQSFGLDGAGCGGLVHTFTKSELKEFFLREVERYYRQCREDGSSTTLLAATCVGKQPKKDVWVLSPSLQLDSNGVEIPSDQQTFYWVDKLLPSTGTSELEVPRHFNILRPVDVLRDVFLALSETLHENAIAGIFTVASVCLSMHYETVLQLFKCCPVPIVIGDVNTGKTTSCRMASRMTGAKNGVLGYTRERFLPKATSKSSIPVILDDAEPSGIRGLMTKYFNGGVDATCTLESTPKCCPIISANWFALSKLAGCEREMTRAVIIPFMKTQRRRTEEQFLAESRRHELEDKVVHCLPLLISVGAELKKQKVRILQKCRVLVARSLAHLSDADDRLHLTYGILLFMVQLLLQKANIPDFPPEMAETFLQTTILHYGIEQFQIGNAKLHGLPSPTKSIADVAHLITEATQVSDIGELLTAINPRVEVRGTNGLAFHLVTLLEILAGHQIEHPSKDACRKAISADPLMSAVQVYLNVEKTHDIISRGGLHATGPRNKRGIWMPYSRFTATQLAEIESAFKIETKQTRAEGETDDRGETEAEVGLAVGDLETDVVMLDVEGPATGDRVGVEQTKDDTCSKGGETDDRGETEAEVGLAVGDLETDVVMLDVEGPATGDRVGVEQTKDDTCSKGDPALTNMAVPVTLETAHRKLFVDEKQPSVASATSTFVREPFSSSTCSPNDSQRHRVNEADKKGEKLINTRVDRASRKRRALPGGETANKKTLSSEGSSSQTLAEKSKEDESYCRTCMRTAPKKSRHHRSKKIKWISCNNCCDWFHQECLGMDLSNREAQNLVFKCSKCLD